MQSFSAVFIAALAGAISVSAAPVASLGAPTGEHSVAATLADDGSGVATELTIREQLRPPSGLPTSSSPVGLPEVMDFAAWKAEFGKRYGSHAEELRRASIFAENVALIERHNGDRTKSFRLGALSRTTQIWDTNSPMISDSSGVPVLNPGQRRCQPVL
eukprot:SAG31_NODE_1388_length_8538_cov_3.310843_7_plen_159_part_00